MLNRLSGSNAKLLAVGGEALPDPPSAAIDVHIEASAKSCLLLLARTPRRSDKIVTYNSALALDMTRRPCFFLGGRTVTRTPTRLQLVCDDRLEGSPFAYVHVQGAPKGPKIVAAGDAVDLAVRACTTQLTNDSSFSKTEIVVEYHDTNVVPLTLIDLPGLMAGGVEEGDVDAVKDIITHFAAQENTIVVAVSKSTDDGANDPSFNLIRLKHPYNDWIAVNSKLDLLEADEDGPGKLKEKVKWLKSQVGHSGRHFGVIAMDKSSEELEKHKEFWGKTCNSPEWLDDTGAGVTFGIPELAAHMHDKLLTGFFTALPNLTATLDASIASLQDELDASPAQIHGDADDLRKIVQGVITEVVDTIGPEPKSGNALPDSIDQTAVQFKLNAELDNYVLKQQEDFLALTIERTYKKFKLDPSTMYQDYDHGDVPLFHEIIGRFDPDLPRNDALKDLINSTFSGYLTTIVSDLVIPKLESVKWKASSKERINVATRFPTLNARLSKYITDFFVGVRRHRSRGEESLLGYVQDTVQTILLLTARFAPAKSVREYQARAKQRDEEAMADRLKSLASVRETLYYTVVMESDMEKMLQKLLDACRGHQITDVQINRVLNVIDLIVSRILTLEHEANPEGGQATVAGGVSEKERRRLSAVVGEYHMGPIPNKAIYVRLGIDGGEAGKLKWYRSKDHWKAAPDQPIGMIDIQKDRPSLEVYEKNSIFGVVIRHGKKEKKFQWRSRVQRGEFYDEMVKWRDTNTLEPTYTGWFNKKGAGRMDGWRRRFFVLDGQRLRYFVSDGVGRGAQQMGAIEIRAGTSSEVDEKDEIIIRGSGSHRRILRLRATEGGGIASELVAAIRKCAADAGKKTLNLLHAQQDPRQTGLAAHGGDGNESDSDGSEDEHQGLTTLADGEDDDAAGTQPKPRDLTAELRAIYFECFGNQKGTVEQ